MNTPPALRRPVGVQPQFSHALGGIWRLTVRRAFSPRQCLITAVVIVLFALLTVASVRSGNSGHYFLWVTNVYLTVIVPVLAFLSGGGLVRDDMNPAVVDYVLTRPVSRPVFLASRVLCHLACLQAWFILALLTLTVVGVIQNIPDAVAALPRLLLAQLLAGGAFGVLGVLAGALTARYLVLGIAYGAIIEVGMGNIPMQLNRLSIIHHVRSMLGPIMDQAGIAVETAQGALASTGFVAVLSAVALGAAIAIFSMREFAGTRPKEA